MEIGKDNRPGHGFYLLESLELLPFTNTPLTASMYFYNIALLTMEWDFLNIMTLLENLDRLITIMLVEKPKIKFRCLHTSHSQKVLFLSSLAGIFFLW